ncbi:OPT superfamily oligopeptide transporter [Meira miltonrushii]|uniref:OPT superfamily oligopeptide transporter n=1 Tax=Meira miltonrushii TaxID=1280837 RepID=A0A316V5B7_9BASI|nr:OPT superfamily oligopeptide transporter [Meira miltonrushii]PWN32769.1 OPT superfamily oligopeptide transporter [Meira miltonrushii]
MASLGNGDGRGRAREGLIPEDLTLRSLVGGIIVGTLLCCTNLYLGLQSAFITMASMQAALVGYGLLRCITAVNPRKNRNTGRTHQGQTYDELQDDEHSDDDERDDTSFHDTETQSISRRLTRPFSAQENTVLQATAVSLGAMPLCAGLIGIVPAFNLLSPNKDGKNIEPFSFSLSALILWCASMAFFGIFFASPMRNPMIIQEKLRFPSGSATAQLIALLHGERLRDDDEVKVDTRVNTHAQTSRQRPPLQRSITEREQEEEVQNGWKGLLITFTASVGITIASFLVPVLYAIPIFDLFLPGHDAASKWGWQLTPSLSYVGQGIIMGPQTTISLFAGAVVGWGILSPVVHYLGWTNGIPKDAEEGSQAWILWVALAIMTSESIVGLAIHSTSHSTSVTKIIRRLQGRSAPTEVHQHRLPKAQDCEKESRLTPNSWVIGGFLFSTVLSAILLYVLFKNNEAGKFELWVPAIGILLAGLLSILAVRALGATDLNPVNALGKLSQLAFAFLQPGNIIVNMVGGALSEAGAMQAGELMQDYKTGHLIRASPRSQFIGQMVGSTVGIFVSATAYKLYEGAYDLPGPEMPAPAARLWLNFARLINNGSLPPHSGQAMIISGLLFALTTLVKGIAELVKQPENERNPPKQSKWIRYAVYIPNGIAFAVGLGLNTPNYSIARLVGGMIVLYVQKRRAAERKKQGRKVKKSSNSLPPVVLLIWSAGFVLGEGFASIILLFLKQAGFGPLTCWGCRGGCGGGC